MFFTFLTKIFDKYDLSLLKSVLLFVFFVSVLQSILFLAHFLVHQTFITHLNLSPESFWFILFSQLFFWLSMSFIFFSILGSYFYYPIIRFGYTLAAWWVGTLYWLVLASVVISIVTLFLTQVSGVFNSLPHLTVTLFLVAFGISLFGTRHVHSLKKTHFTVALKNLPETWIGQTVVVVADTHFGHVWGIKRAAKIVALIQEVSPALLLIPGDFYDGPPADYAVTAALFGAISPPHGTYFCAGNHEQFRPSTPYTDALTDAGIHVLTNEKVLVEGLQIIGLSYLESKTATETNVLLTGLTIDPLLPSILLKHVPRDPEVAAEHHIDLTVSGHTHRGQVWPWGSLTRRLYRGFDGGMRMIGDSCYITTSGAGTWGPMQRVGSDSEIVIITLTKKV